MHELNQRRGLVGGGADLIQSLISSGFFFTLHSVASCLNPSLSLKRIRLLLPPPHCAPAQTAMSRNGNKVKKRQNETVYYLVRLRYLGQSIYRVFQYLYLDDSGPGETDMNGHHVFLTG